jgi:two-component system, sensor histidine kinase and response regulator
MGTRIERAFRIGFALALVVFLGARTVVYRSTKHLLDIDRLIEHSQEVLVTMEDIQSMLDEGALSTRNYVRSSDERDLDRFTSAKSHMTALVRLLRSLTADDPVQQKWVEELEARLASTFQYWSETAAKRNEGESAGAEQRMFSARALQLMRGNRLLIVAMSRRENQILGGRSREAETWARHAILIELFLAVAALGFLLVAYLFVQMDVNEKARAQEELQRAKEAAEAANEAKSAFLATMSHEIRTPMNGILGMTDLILDTELTAEQRADLGLVKFSAVSLLSIINDILDFSKIEAGKLELESISFDLRESLSETMKMLRFRAHQKGLGLIYEVQPEVPEALLGDPGRTRQILINIVGNAIKFTEHGEIFVRVEEQSQGPATTCLHFAVKDSGVGIPADRQQKIFEAFTQADSSMARKFGGTGLGLTICVRLVEMMGGRIWVESEHGQGSTFHFTVQLALQSKSSARSIPLQPEQLRDLHALIVDDDPTNRRVLQGMLNRWGMKPVAVGSGAAALQALESAKSAGHPFPLILLDGQMPEIDGFTLAERLKKDPDLVGATIMMLTSAGHLGDAARCRDLGISGYLVKPIREGDLFDAICNVLNEVPENKSVALVTRHTLRENQNRLRILLAEDNAVNQTLAVRLLEKRGYRVSVVGDGRAAIAALEQESFDLVLMDMQMPEMDGFEATAAIRTKEELSGGHVPIIAMTAHALKGDRERCLAGGMDGYIPKPIRTSELFSTIESVIAKNSEPAAAHAACPTQIKT